MCTTCSGLIVSMFTSKDAIYQLNHPLCVAVSVILDVYMFVSCDRNQEQVDLYCLGLCIVFGSPTPGTKVPVLLWLGMPHAVTLIANVSSKPST